MLLSIGFGELKKIFWKNKKSKKSKKKKKICKK
jgi:hypothetical protein